VIVAPIPIPMMKFQHARLFRPTAKTTASFAKNPLRLLFFGKMAVHAPSQFRCNVATPLRAIALILLRWIIFAIAAKANPGSHPASFETEVATVGTKDLLPVPSVPLEGSTTLPTSPNHISFPKWSPVEASNRTITAGLTASLIDSPAIKTVLLNPFNFAPQSRTFPGTKKLARMLYIGKPSLADFTCGHAAKLNLPL